MKVVTEASVVYLMGLVMRKEADAASEIAAENRSLSDLVFLATSDVPPVSIATRCRRTTPWRKI